ncbi:MAG: YcaO-like family protein, partial [Halothiobacillaceae bacterium]|nr:YcaO-like family protein [Halothiobacillaceae bacterium]
MSELTRITGKDAPLEESIAHLLDRLARHGFDIEEARWLNPVPHVWSVHIRDRRCPLLFTNGKGASRKAALASALGEFVERLSTNYFFADYYLGEDARRWPFAHYPQERWFPIEGEAVPAALLDERLREHYDPEGELTADLLVDMNTGDRERGICALPFTREGDGATVWIPVNILGNLYVSNGLSAGNTRFEARTQALSEVFERHVKNRVIAEGLCLPDVPEHVLARFADVQRAIDALRAQGYRVLVKDASLGGRFPVMNVTLINPDNGGVFASFGAHPRLDVALERTLTELLQGRDLNELDVFQPPSLDLDEVADPHNLETHFIDSSGLIAWEFL